jgi:hypothetical protein
MGRERKRKRGRGREERNRGREKIVEGRGIPKHACHGDGKG